MTMRRWILLHKQYLVLRPQVYEVIDHTKTLELPREAHSWFISKRRLDFEYITEDDIARLA